MSQGTPGSSGDTPNALCTAVNGKGLHKAHFSKNDCQRTAFQYLDEPWIFTIVDSLMTNIGTPKPIIFSKCAQFTNFLKL